MISHKYKFIFVRTPKTASTSVLDVLESYELERLPIQNVQEPLFNFEGKKYDCNHPPIQVIKKSTTKNIFNDYFKFSFVRNPWDRCVSAWRYNIKKKFTPRGAPFVEFVRGLESEEIGNYKYLNQYDFVKGCDFIGRFENLQEDFDTICDKVGISRQKLSHENKTRHANYVELYNDEAREIIAEKCKKDIEYFGYEYGE
jgi:hypothetical protein